MAANEDPGDDPRESLAESPAEPDEFPAEPAESPAEPVAGPPRARVRLALLLRVVGFVLAGLAIAFLVVTLVSEWPEVQEAVRNANPLLVGAAVITAALAMMGLAVLWWEVLHGFHGREPLREVMSWYFAGELGKYLPGGIWPVVGRGELAARNGVPRSMAYGTTAMSLGLMIIGGAALGALLFPLTISGGELGFEHLILLLVPIGLIVIHPRVMGMAFALLTRFSKGRLVFEPLPWGRMVQLVLTAIPAWAFVGLTSVLLAESFGFDYEPARIMLAAVLGWIAGFLVVPVPAGAGIREIVFVALSGLESGPSVVIATVARFVFIVVDGTGGMIALAWLRSAGEDTGPAEVEAGS